MSCTLSETDLFRRKARAMERGWSWIPEFGRVDAECPYCGAELAFEYDYEGDDEAEEECPSCGTAFDVLAEWEPSYELSRKDGKR